MARVNNKTKLPSLTTHEGVPASRISNELQLRRSVMSCMLWENEFYEDGATISDRISNLIKSVDPITVAKIAVDARNKQHLRHMPLFIASKMAALPEHRKYVSSVLAEVIQRPDELSEYLAIYWKNGKCPISAQSKKGLARAFNKFTEFQFSKWNRDSDIKLRDVLFLCHAKPINKEQEELWKKLINNELVVPDTWEKLLSAAGSNTLKKKEAFEYLIKNRQMGALAVLRNLRNMQLVNVDSGIIKEALASMNVKNVLPFRFIEAVKYASRYEKEIEGAMLRSLDNNKIGGKTILVVDRSGSMHSNLSSKSNLTRQDAADALAIIAASKFSDITTYATAGNDMKRTHATELIPARQGYALVDAMKSTYHKIGGGGIFLKQVMDYVKSQEKSADRVIVITDEQDCDNINPATADAFGKENYIINIASNKNGIAYNKFTHIDGFSEASIEFIAQYTAI